MFNSKYSSFLTVVIAIIAIVALLGFLGYDMYQKYYIQKKSDEIISQLENQTNYNNDDNDHEKEQEQPGEVNTNPTDEVKNPYDDVQSAMISNGNNNSGVVVKNGNKEVGIAEGTIDIPATGIKYPIIDRITKQSLETAIVLVYPTTSENGEPLLNQKRNTTFAGHNYRNGTFFSNNKKLKVGDIVNITDTTGRKITYEIYQIQELSENDSTYINRDTNGIREISLSTCTENPATRLVIFAREK